MPTAAHQSARKMFPNMPDDVFEQWITPQILCNGWPFSHIHEPMPCSGWAKYFRNQPISFWANVNWKFSSIHRFELQLEQSAIDNASKVVENGKIFINTKVMPKTLIPDSVERFLTCAKFIGGNGKLPKPLVCFLNADKSLLLLDGHHRFAAMEALNVQSDFPVDMWVGSHG